MTPRRASRLPHRCSGRVKEALPGQAEVASRRKAGLAARGGEERLGRERLAEAGAADEAADARRRRELAVLDQQRAPQEHVLGRAHDLAALVEVVVAARVVAGSRDRLSPLGVEDDEVGVGADRDRPLAWVEAEELRRLGREQVD